MTMALSGLAIAALIVASIAFLLVRSWLHMRGTRLVTCPETHAAAAVELDLKHTLVTGAAGFPEYRLRDCSRWPEKERCGQMCLAEIEEAPHDCLVREILRRWYDDTSCALCGRDMAPVRWHDHKPALKAEDDRIWEWGEVPPEQLPALLQTARPVCWNCMIAEGFRRDHPDLVVERPRPPRPPAHRA
jgi:hypothetical protein